jgi:hypothetical protein
MREALHTLESQAHLRLPTRNPRFCQRLLVEA